jgi:hypothetical protein
MQYTGEFLAVAKLVQDAAQGGMVLVSEGAKAQLSLSSKDNVVVAHAGEHELSSTNPNTHLYAATKETLLPRLVHLGPVRSIRPLSLGFLAAPFSEAAIGFMTASGLSLLHAYSAGLAAESVAVYRRTVQAELMRRGGYLVEESGGLHLVAFHRASRAIRWALNSVQLCMEADWPRELLEHELGGGWPRVLKPDAPCVQLLTQVTCHASGQCTRPLNPVVIAPLPGHAECRGGEPGPQGGRGAR